ncbi:MAG: ferritin [Angelakisella sp.]
MTDANVTALLGKQINKELYSSYLYLAIAGYYAEQNLDGFANWYEVQAKEELDHALLFRQYMLNDGSPVVLEAIDQPEMQINSIADGVKLSLAHEQMITASIGDIYTEALAKRDYKTTQFLDWFIKEQGEEEKNATDLCKKVELFGSDPKSLYMLNAELAARVYAPPSLVL